MPTAFSTAPFTLSVILGSRLFFVAGAFFFSTRPVAVAFARGLDMLALALGIAALDLGAADFLAFAGGGATAGVKGFRGAGWPVAPRVRAVILKLVSLREWDLEGPLVGECSRSIRGFGSGESRRVAIVGFVYMRTLLRLTLKICESSRVYDFFIQVGCRRLLRCSEFVVEEFQR